MSQYALSIALAIFAAGMHSAANALVKSSCNPLLTRGAMNVGAILLSVPLLPLVALPDRLTWVFLGASICVHAAYPFLLTHALRHADLGASLPIARGVSPIVVAALSATLMSTPYSGLQVICILGISAGVVIMALDGGRKGLTGPGVKSALATGLVVGIYTTIDAAGLAVTSSQAGYIVWLLFLDGMLVTALVSCRQYRSIRTFLGSEWRKAGLASFLGVTNFSLAMYALSIGPAGVISALRETTVLFSVLAGVLYFKEKVGPYRLAGASLITVGAFGLAFAHS